jgi:hypothetical protein
MAVMKKIIVLLMTIFLMNMEEPPDSFNEWILIFADNKELKMVPVKEFKRLEQCEDYLKSQVKNKKHYKGKKGFYECLAIDFD